MNAISILLPGYEVGAEVFRAGSRVVYRGKRIDDGAPVDVVTLDAEYPDRQQVAELKHDGAIAGKLSDVDGVLKVHALQAHGSGNLALICEPMASSLKMRLAEAKGQGLPLKEVLDIAWQLTRTLGEVHSRDIVHKALTPGRVLFDPASGETRLAGFSMASELEQERQGSQMSRRLEGPLPYISPEQTGRMNRDLDYRSDFYSLGVLLFELLTGQRPFQADTLLEWVYSHISRMPPSPQALSSSVPDAVSAIVLKLLAKNPEERYQSAGGLAADLAHCADELAVSGTIEPFVLGRHDVAQKFLVPQHVYGREHELVQLFSLFESAVQGGNECCLVHGYSGVGKSALVNEIDRPLVREQGFLVQGKFDQFQYGEAYTALATAFRGLVQQVLGEPEARQTEWRQALNEALAPNARLVLNLVPELELIIGDQPAVAELPPAEARNRLHIVLTNFLRVFAGEGHPVVLFLDDLQWSDAPTLELLRRLVTSRELSHLLLIGAYRSNEVGVGHPLCLMLDDLQAQKNISQIALAPLEKDSVANLVADALKRDVNETASLSDMLYAKAQGNPFFTNQLLRQLYTEGAIAPAPGSGYWNWDLDAARWSVVSHDVVEFMVENLRQMQPATQQVLQLAACIGSTFDLHTLAAIYERSVSETAATLLPALKQHTVLPLHSNYRLVGEGSEPLEFNPTYRFQHDRVQQAAYALIDTQRLQGVHLTVGRLMRQHAGDAVPDERLIDIVGHLNEGRPLIESADERLQLAEMNLRAGVRAKRSAAYQAALNYLQVAAELLPDDPWQKVQGLMQALAAETQQCAYLSGHVDEAESWIEVMLEHANSDLQRSEILATRTRQYATLGRMEESILSAIQGLSLLGMEFSDHPGEAEIAEERRLVEENLGERRIADLVDAALVEDTSTLSAMRLLMESFPAAFLSGSGNLFSYLVLKAVNLSLRHGNCPASAFAYAAYGMLLCGELDEPALGYQYAKAGLAINQRLDDVTLRARVIYVYAMFVHHWSNHWASLTQWFRKGIEAGYQSGDLLYLAYSAQDCVIWDPTLELETAHRQHAERLEIVRECAYQDSLDSGTLFLQLQRNLLGLTNSPCSLSDDSFDEQACLAGMRQRQFMTGIANYHIYSAELCLLYGSYDRALEHVRHLMEAELERLDGARESALAHYDAAIDAARRSGFLHDEATACERAARHLLTLDRRRAAEGYLRGAHHLYNRWGAVRKVAMLEHEFPVLRELGSGAHLPVAARGEPWELDLASVMKASRAISSEIVLSRLLQTTMDILLENAGAQWGCLVVRRDAALSVEASATTLDDNSRSDRVPPSSRVVNSQGGEVALPMTLISQVLRSSEAVVLHDAADEGPFAGDPYMLECRPSSVLCVPIRRERFDGALYMENNLASGAFTKERVEVIRLLAAQASVAIENARLYEQVQDYSRTLEEKVVERTARLKQLNTELQGLVDRDGLTGVANRRRGDAYLEEVWTRQRRQKQPLSIIMLDVDHFKAFNDNYGHQAGDDCLTAVAETAQAQLLRPDDLIARYGGEEFMLILPNTDSDGAARVGEKVRRAVEVLAITHAHSSAASVVTVSAGTATLVPDKEEGAEHLLREADIALYRAKRMGRNQVRSSSEVALR
ncbi:MAG: diguanylate cyclase [Candidatus Thiodiazotropha sp.]